MTNALGMMDAGMLRDMMSGGMMLHSIMLARVIAPIMLIVGLGVLFNPSYFHEMMDEIGRGKQQMVLFVSGFVTLIIGVLLVMAHNIWVWNWSVIITVFSWLTLIKGAVIILLPKSSMAIANSYKGISWMPSVMAIVMLVVGLVLGYFGYMANGTPMVPMM